MMVGNGLPVHLCTYIYMQMFIIYVILHVFIITRVLPMMVGDGLPVHLCTYMYMQM